MAKKSYPELWLLYPSIWKTKSKFFTWLRGGLRRALWEKYPPKIVFKNKNCHKPPEGLETRAKSGNYCSLSGEWAGKSNLEVDHKEGNASLNEWEDLEPFILHLITTEDNMQLVSKEAHKIKSYAERMGISFEEATAVKKAIEYSKLPVYEQVLILETYKIKDASNAKKRRAAFETLAKKGVL